MIFEVPRPLLGAKMATKSDLGALGSTFEPSKASESLDKPLDGSWRGLEGS